MAADRDAGQVGRAGSKGQGSVVEAGDRGGAEDRESSGSPAGGTAWQGAGSELDGIGQSIIVRICPRPGDRWIGLPGGSKVGVQPGVIQIAGPADDGNGAVGGKSAGFPCQSVRKRRKVEGHICSADECGINQIENMTRSRDIAGQEFNADVLGTGQGKAAGDIDAVVAPGGCDRLFM